MKVIYHGPLWYGSTSLQRLNAFKQIPGVEVIPSDNGGRVRLNLYQRIRWRLRWPVDIGNENETLIKLVEKTKADVLFVDNSRVIRRSTLQKIRSISNPLLVYYTPDNIIATHNSSWPIRLSFSEWELFFTTKTFNIPELFERGVRRPVLIGKAFDPDLHRPLVPLEVGPNFERYDIVFIGVYEHERLQYINRLAKEGFSIAVFGSNDGNWANRFLHPAVSLFSSVYAEEYTRGMHFGKVGLCFLRKINRDRVTQRSVEIPAMARPMLAEKTGEHDSYFMDGEEYVSFRDEKEMIEKAHLLIKDDRFRNSVGRAGRERCLASGYSTLERAQEMMSVIQSIRKDAL